MVTVARFLEEAGLEEAIDHSDPISRRLSTQAEEWLDSDEGLPPWDDVNVAVAAILRDVGVASDDRTALDALTWSVYNWI